MSARKSNRDLAGTNLFMIVFAVALVLLLVWLFLSRPGAPLSGASDPDAAAPGAAATAEGPVLSGMSSGDGAAGDQAAAATSGDQAAASGDPSAPGAVAPLSGASAPVEGAVPAPANLPSPLPACPALDVGCGAWAAPPSAPAIQLRPAPSLGSAVSVELPAGTEVYLLEVLRGGPEGTWWRLRTADGFEGWINGDDLMRASQQ